MSGYRLALDMDTGTLGWALWELDADERPVRLTDWGVRVFSEGREPARNGRTGSSLAVQRRLSRQVRKIRRRNKRRKQIIIHELARAGLLPALREERELLKNVHPDCVPLNGAPPRVTDLSEQKERNKSWDPYLLRKEALDRKLDPFELGRVLTHLTSRRGYRSNGSGAVSEQTLERKKNLLKIRELERRIEAAGSRTLGEYLYQIVEENRRVDELKTGRKETVRFKPDMVTIFPSRDMYTSEFDAIRSAQEQWYSQVDWDRLRRLMYHQRPLKNPERSFCPYYIDTTDLSRSERRGFRAQPSAHRFRILNVLSELSYIDESDTVWFLTAEQKDILYGILETQKSLSCTEAAKRVGLPPGGYFPEEKCRNQKLIGNETSCDMRKPEYFGALWDSFAPEEQDNIIEELITNSSEEDIEKKIAAYPLSVICQKNILAYSFKAAAAPYSARFMRECAEIMKKEHTCFDETVAKLNLHPASAHPDNSLEMLPYYGEILPDAVILPAKLPAEPRVNPETRYGKIWNPTVHILLNQTRIVVNTLIGRYGKPTQIYFRLSGDLKKSREGRDAANRMRTQNRRDEERVGKLFRGMGIRTSDFKTRELYSRWRLWNELPDYDPKTEAELEDTRCGDTDETRYNDTGNLRAKTCVYCGKPISLEQLVSGEADAGFILPVSHTLLDTYRNMTVAHTTCLKDKGDRTPFEAFGANPGEYNWKNIHQRATHFSIRKRALFSAAAGTNEADQALRHLRDESFLARKTVQYFSSICPSGNVRAESGIMPSLLYKTWKLHTILGKKSGGAATDYRYYCLNALIIGTADERLTAEIQKLNYGVWSAEKIRVPRFILNGSEVAARLKKVLASFKPDHGIAGKLFDETALGCHYYPEKAGIDTFRQDDIPLIVSGRLKKTARNLFLMNGWKRTREFLFSNGTEIAVSRPWFVTRKKILLCTEKDIGRIIDADIRERLLKAVSGAKTDQERRELLEGFIAETGIRRVRIIPKGQEAVRVPSSANKAYALADFLFVDIWKIPRQHDCEYRGIFVSRYEAHSYDKSAAKPHPAARFICRLFKNDVLRMESGVPEIIYARIAGFATTQQKLDIRPLCAAQNISTWFKHTSVLMTETYWEDKNSPQNHTAINTIFCGMKHVRRVSVSPDGKVK